MFRSEMISNKMDEQKYAIQDDYRRKLKEQRAANNRKVDEQREVVQRNYEKKLQDDKELETKKNQLTYQSMHDKKERMR